MIVDKENQKLHFKHMIFYITTWFPSAFSPTVPKLLCRLKIVFFLSIPDHNLVCKKYCLSIVFLNQLNFNSAPHLSGVSGNSTWLILVVLASLRSRRGLGTFNSPRHLVINSLEYVSCHSAIHCSLSLFLLWEAEEICQMAASPGVSG